VFYQTGSAAEVTVNTICWLPRGAAEQLLVCNRSATIHLTNLRGEVSLLFLCILIAAA
jgi:hypothetical protein